MPSRSFSAAPAIQGLESLILMGVPVDRCETSGFSDSVPRSEDLNEYFRSEALRKLSGNSMAIRALMAVFAALFKSLKVFALREL